MAFKDYKKNPFTGELDALRTDDSLKEVIAHVDLTDMPDTGGTNTDHDSRYLLLKTATETSHYTGFPNRTDTSLSWDNGTATLTLTDLGSATVWINGVEYALGGNLTCQLSAGDEATSALYWFWIDQTDGVPFLDYGLAPGYGFGSCLTANMYWNTTTSLGFGGDERHWMGRDKVLHEYLHETVGARYYEGLAGVFDSTSFSIEAGEFYDEDIEHEFELQTQCRMMYHDGSDDWEWILPSTLPYKESAGGVIQYNDGTTLEEVGNNKYVNVWVFATNNVQFPIMIVAGTGEHTSSDAANEEAPSLGALPSAENLLLYRVTYRNSGGTPVWQHTTDYRASAHTGSSYVPTDHGALAGLTDDDHPQYALLDSSPTFTGDLTAATGTFGGTSTGDSIMQSGLVVNEAGLGTNDFRVESLNQYQAIFLDASADQLNINVPLVSTSTLAGSNLSGTNTGDQDLSHTGEVTGTTQALSLDKTSISNQTDTTILATDIVLFGDTSDSGNLKKGAVQDILDLTPAPDLSAYWENDGTATATADWDIGDNKFTALYMDIQQDSPIPIVGYTGIVVASIEYGTFLTTSSDIVPSPILGTGNPPRGTILMTSGTNSGNTYVINDAYQAGDIGAFGDAIAPNGGISGFSVGDTFDIIADPFSIIGNLTFEGDTIGSSTGDIGLDGEVTFQKILKVNVISGYGSVLNMGDIVTNSATGDYGVTIGNQLTASASHSFAHGETSRAQYQYGWASGAQAVANAYGGYARGNNAQSVSMWETVFGAWNNENTSHSKTSWVATEPLFTIGNGTSSVKNNAFQIIKNGNVLMPNDSAKLLIGASQDLEIEHDGVDSNINNTTGGLQIQDNGTNRIEIDATGIGLYAVAPVAQATTGGGAATFVANTSAIVDDTATFDGYTIGQVVKALRNIGALA